MKQIVEEVCKSIMDICIEPIAENGMFDPYNDEHIFSLIEKLENKKFSEALIIEAISAIRQEGKYPERQAYNKEGWLVTFPSAEYKNAAIKRGTHFGSDPTHGKGGMNVYYKKKGKQKRMTQQNPSQVAPGTPTPAAAPVAPEAQPVSPPSQSAGGDSNLPSSSDSEGSDDSGDNIDFKSQYDSDPESLPKSDSAEGGGENQPAGNSAPASPPASDAPAAAPEAPPAPVAPPSPPPPSFSNISTQFAKSKKWSPTPYGEWRNIMGEPAAVVGLGGEVVPLKSTDREELKLFAQKRMS